MERNRINSKVLYIIFIFTFSTVGLVLSKEIKNFKDEVVLRCFPGKEPGNYIFIDEPGYVSGPRCFAIDPNDGSFYISDMLEYGYYCRIQKFGKNGKFFKEFYLDKGIPGYEVFEMHIALNGDIYLQREVYASHLICQCDKEGRLLNMLGPQGPLTENDFQEFKKIDFHNTPSANARLFHALLDVFPVNDNKVFIVEKYPSKGKHPDTYEFDAKTGKLLKKIKENENLPEKLADYREKRREKSDILDKTYKKLKKEPPHIMNSVIGPDDNLYYMTVTKEKLEIHKVTVMLPIKQTKS